MEAEERDMLSGVPCICKYGWLAAKLLYLNISSGLRLGSLLPSRPDMSASNYSNEKNLSINFINPVGLYDPRPNAYTHVVGAEMPARLIYIAGQGGENEDGVLSPDFDKQVHQALCNLRIALNAADASLEKVVKLTLLIVDHNQERLTIVGRQLQEVWGEHPLPACTLIPVPRLALDGMLFEIDATAVVAR